MSTDTTVSPLRQRMIGDVAARKLGPHSGRCLMQRTTREVRVIMDALGMVRAH